MTAKVGILTDSTVQFPVAAFPGHDLVHIMPLSVQLNGSNGHKAVKTVRLEDLPMSVKNGLEIVVEPPSEGMFLQAFRNLSRQYNQLIVITMSGNLSKTYQNAYLAAQAFGNDGSLIVIDSQTAGAGLGLLVQVAAYAASEGEDGMAIKHLLLQKRNQLYSLFCIKGLTYLAHSVNFDLSQAVVAEMLDVTPLFVLENGNLITTQKVRSSRHLVDCFYEFVTEFSSVVQIALMQGVPPFEYEARTLRQRLSGMEFCSGYSEHVIDPALAGILGPKTLGLFVMEDDWS